MNSDNNEPASEMQVYNHKSSIIIKLLISIIIIISIILIVATNPNEINYDTFLKNQAIQSSNGNPIATGLTELFGSSLIDSSTIRSNYVLFSTYKTAINSNQSIVYLGILGHFVPISSNNTASNNPTASSSNSVANGVNSSTPITPQPTAPNVQAQSTDQINKIDQVNSSLGQNGNEIEDTDLKIASLETQIVDEKTRIIDSKQGIADEQGSIAGNPSSANQAIQNYSQEIQDSNTKIAQYQTQLNQLNDSLNNLKVEQKTLESQKNNLQSTLSEP
jgi:hypothetical protein